MGAADGDDSFAASALNRIQFVISPNYLTELAVAA